MELLRQWQLEQAAPPVALDLVEDEARVAEPELVLAEAQPRVLEPDPVLALPLVLVEALAPVLVLAEARATDLQPWASRTKPV